VVDRILRNQVANGKNVVTCDRPVNWGLMKNKVVPVQLDSPANDQRQIPNFLGGCHRPPT